MPARPIASGTSGRISTGSPRIAKAAFARLLAAGDVARTSTYAAAHDPTKANINRASENVDQVTAAQDVAVLLTSDRVARVIGAYAESLVDYYNLMIDLADLTPAARSKALADGNDWELIQGSCTRPS